MWILKCCFAPSPHNRGRDVKAGALQESADAKGNCGLQLQVAWRVTALIVLKIRQRRTASDNTKLKKMSLTWVANSFWAYFVQIQLC